MSQQKTILITGATGKQGGALVRQLAGKNFQLRAMTRKPDSDAAKALSAAGVQLVTGDLDDADSLGRALTGVWGTFAVQNTWEAGVEKEEEQGKRFAKVAREKGVQHFVYASVGGANRATKIPHFDNKYRVEQTIRSLSFPSWVILRPVFFMENLPSPWFLNGDKLISALKPDTRLQMIAVEDIGYVASRAFIDADRMNGEAIDLAGDNPTLAESAAVLSSALGRKIEYMQIPISEVRKNSEDFALMLEWFESTGYDASIPGLERRFDRKMLKLADWAKKLR